MVNVSESKTNPVDLSKVHGERKLEGQDELELLHHLRYQMLVPEEGALRIERPKEARVPHQRLREHECQRSICTRRCRACRASAESCRGPNVVGVGRTKSPDTDSFFLC